MAGRSIFILNDLIPEKILNYTEFAEIAEKTWSKDFDSKFSPGLCNEPPLSLSLSLSLSRLPYIFLTQTPLLLITWTNLIAFLVLFLFLFPFFLMWKRVFLFFFSFFKIIQSSNGHHACLSHVKVAWYVECRRLDIGNTSKQEIIKPTVQGFLFLSKGQCNNETKRRLMK